LVISNIGAIRGRAENIVMICIKMIAKRKIDLRCEELITTEIVSFSIYVTNLSAFCQKYCFVCVRNKLSVVRQYEMIS